MDAKIEQKYEKLRKDGHVAVLYSIDVGAGWFTWNDAVGLVFDKEIVEAVLAGRRDEAAMIAERKYPGAYTGGARDLEVAWVPEGCAFEINEDAGAESIRITDGGGYRCLVA